MDTQDNIFMSFEGDRYLERRKKSNRSDQQRIKEDIPLKLIERNNINFNKVAEVGAYNGFRLAHLSEKYACQTVAFEPSIKAIADGKKKYPNVKFHHNTAVQLDANDSDFDMVIIDFVFHWIDRKNLLRSVAEIDRILTEDGWLIVGDFWVDHPQRRRYHHLSEIELWTYKQNYWDIFLSSNCYQLFDSISNNSINNEIIPRYCTLMKKSLTSGYPIE